jgi:hypothetical protein
VQGGGVPDQTTTAAVTADAPTTSASGYAKSDLGITWRVSFRIV